jgi:predicted DNA-binding protein (MmcQ/YjbR family)
MLAYCQRLACATEEYPFGPQVAVFKIGGKLFALVSREDEPGSVSLKCDPGYAVALRERYPAVTPGYHLAKRHWNTVRLDGSVDAAELREWIDESYGLVVAGLSRARRAGLGLRPAGDSPSA